MDFSSAAVEGKCSEANLPCTCALSYNMTGQYISLEKWPSTLKPWSLQTVGIYCFIFWMMLTITGDTVSAFPDYLITVAPKESNSCHFSLLKIYFSKHTPLYWKRNTAQVRRETAQLIYWLIGWLIDFRASVMSSSFLHFENSAALSSSKQPYLIECLVFAKGNMSDVFPYTSIHFDHFLPCGWYLFLHSELTWEN